MAFFRRFQSNQQDSPATPAPSDDDDAATPSADSADEETAAEETSSPAEQKPEAVRRTEAVTQPLHPLHDEPDEEENPDADDVLQIEDVEEELTPAYPQDDTAMLTGSQADEAEPLDDDTHMLDPEQMPAISTHRSLQGLAFAARRDIGRIRQSNQDSVLAMLTCLPRENADIPLGLFVVADGMGGHEGGEIASRLAIRTVMHQVLAQLVMPTLDDTMIEALQPMMISAVQEANQAIWEYSQMHGSDMGTTCTAVLLLGRALYIAHVGDSRAYLREAGGLRALTSDHSTVGRLIEMGQLDPAAAHDHPLRNQLYRTIGQQPHVEVDFIYQQLEASTHLLVCSDGLWGMISDKHIEEALDHSPWPQDACDELIALANLAGGEDNISAIVVTLPVTERLRA